MRGLRELSVVGRSLAQPPINQSSAHRICVFCQSRTQQPKRTFALSSRVAAIVQADASAPPRSASEDQKRQDDESTLPAEFEYDIEPEEPQFTPSKKKSPQRIRRERRTAELLAARRTKQRKEYAQRKKDMDERNANQERLAEVLEKKEEDVKTRNATKSQLAPGEKIGKKEDSELYKEAATTAGMRIVGAEPKKERATFEPFARPGLSTKSDILSHEMHGNRIHMTAALYRAVVETYAAISAGKRIVPSTSYHASTLFNETKDVKMCLSVAGDPEGAGAVRLKYPDAETERKVLATGHASKASKAYLPDLKAANEIVNSWGRVWLHIPLEDPQIKLGVIKRLTYLIGRRISDYIIDQSTTTFILLTHIARPDPPKNVYQAVHTTREPDTRLKSTRDIPKHPAPLLTALPNVQFRGRKLTVREKETQIGRYKVIQQELKRRRDEAFDRELKQRGLDPSVPLQRKEMEQIDGTSLSIL